MKSSHLIFYLRALLILGFFCEYSFSIILPLIRRNHTLPIHFQPRNGEGFPLRGGIGSIAEFYATIILGSQTLTVSIDTGSTDLLLDGFGCSGCSGSSSFVSDSSTQTYVCPSLTLTCSTCVTVSSSSVCGFSDTYGSGATVSGYIVSDFFLLDNFSSIRVAFGYIQSVSGGNFINAPVDGIWGLAYPSLSSWGGNSALDTIISSNNLQNIFSMCLVQSDPSMSIGVDYTNIAGTQWTPIIQQSWYVVTVNDIQVNGNSLGLSSSVYNSNPSIVDSGTTLFTLPSQAYTAFKNTLMNMCSSVNLHGICDASTGQTLFDKYCYTMLSSQISQYPNIEILLNGATLSIPNTQYLYLETGGFYCLGVDQSPSGSGVILGDVVMQGFHVIFDKTNLRVGFAPLSSCPIPVSSSNSSSNSILQTKSQLILLFILQFILVFLL